MSAPSHEQAFDGSGHPYTGPTTEWYEHSIASSAPSSQFSVFSQSGSTQSSIASSISDDFRQNHDDAQDRACAQLQIQSRTSIDNIKACVESLQANAHTKTWCSNPLSYADVTSASQGLRQHPRRNSLARNQKPPPLVRQDDRKVNFVESLVDSATQMVEVIWPLSVVPCRSEGPNGRGVLPLRTYIEETLRRSRTSYSTLQVALYYLVLIKSHVPKDDFTQEQREDCPANRALMCGRRMFLAALILASKYLQDRNYSAKAWSKMSGLRISEITVNERIFLAKVNWKLHIPEPIFKRWTEVVLKYTPHPYPPSPDQAFGIPVSSWKTVVPLLTPELDTVSVLESRTRRTIDIAENFGPISSVTPTPTRPSLNNIGMQSTSQEGTPTPTSVIPRYLEPRPDVAPPTPALARMGPLPTPQLTPSSVASSTPAASACSSRRPSMCSAMSLVQQGNFNRCAIDTFPAGYTSKDNFAFGSRRPSIASVTSTRSSPESMISDRSNLSRASSISSVSTASSIFTGAPNRACLARQATCRNARLTMPSSMVMEEKDGSATKPIVIADDTEMVSSPDVIDFAVSEKVLHTPHRHSKHASQPVSSSSMEKSRKRARPHGGNRRSNLQEEVRWLVEEAQDELMDIDDEDDVVDLTTPSPAAEHATKLLSRSGSVICSRAAQPPATLCRSGSARKPVQKCNGSKRSCCSTAMSISPAPMFGEVA